MADNPNLCPHCKKQECAVSFYYDHTIHVCPDCGHVKTELDAKGHPRKSYRITAEGAKRK